MLSMLFSVVKVFVTVTISPDTPTTVGGSVAMSCSATLPDGLSGTLSFQWEGPGGSITASGPENVLNISNIMLSQAGQYSCSVSIEFFTVTNSTDLIVQSKYKNYNKTSWYTIIHVYI